MMKARMRTYDVYLSKYLKRKREFKLGDRLLGKTRHLIVEGTSKDTVTRQMRRKYPGNLIQVLVRH